MGINIGSTDATGVWIGGGNNDIVREGLVFWIDSGQYKSYPGSGTDVYDMSGQGNDGTLTNSPSFSDGNIDLDGTDDYINFGDVADYEFAYNEEFTLCAWFYLDSHQGGMIVSKAEGSGNYRGWYLYFSSTTDKLTATLYNDTSPSQRWANVTDSAIAASPANTWFHVCSMYPGSANAGKIYLNGEEVASTLSYNTLGSNTTANSVPLSVGMRDTSSLPFNGKIPIVQIYNRNLSASEVLYNFNANRARFGV